MKNFKYIIAGLIAALIALCGVGAGNVSTASADVNMHFEESKVLDDLKSGNVNLLNYPYDSTGILKHPEIMTVAEYCYSPQAIRRGNYGVYVYFYNPQALHLSPVDGANKITLGVQYSENADGSVKVDDYEKFDLQFCNKSTGDYAELFYKFKIVDRKSELDGKTIAQRVNSNERRYDISEVELTTVGDKTATAYGVGGTYVFTGYAKGYGVDENAESTLACERVDLETVTLDLAGKTDGVDKRTYWRSNSSSKGAHYQNQINSVFFAIDTNVLEKYGYTLQKIKAEWWEYKTAPAVVIDNQSIYNRLKEYCGVKISDVDDERGLMLRCVDIPFGYDPAKYGMNYYYSWNAYLSSSEVVNPTTSDYNDTLLPLLFYTNGIDVDEWVLTAENLERYCENYTKSYEKGHLIIGGKDYSADLFSDDVDEGRTRGYNLREFDISNPDDWWQINSYDSNHNWFEKLLDYGFGSIKTNDDYSDVLPIQMLKTEDFAVSNVADHLKINSDDVTTLRNYYYSSVKDNDGDGKPDNAVFLFRYAQTDYWAHDAHVFDYVNEKAYVNDSTISEVRQGTQFFNFDIMTMTFAQDGEYTTLGVVSSPVDHWAGYTPSIEATQDWKIWIIVIIIIILLLIVLPILTSIFPIVGQVLKWIIKGVVALILAPFKLIAAVIKKRRETAPAREQRKAERLQRKTARLRQKELKEQMRAKEQSLRERKTARKQAEAARKLGARSDKLTALEQRDMEREYKRRRKQKLKAEKDATKRKKRSASSKKKKR